MGAPPIPIDEALRIAHQIAEALEAAHERGVIHRDLKPANVKVRPDGMVKVLDFGLAKAVGPPEGGHYVQNGSSVRLQPDLTDAPTITTPAMTRAGMILGTAAYMAPEQARGRDVDKRADIWAFGCVLYEMLTGRRAFPGEDVTDTLANVLKIDPDWQALPVDVPAALRRLLRRCLDKDARHRVADIAIVLFVLDEVGRAPRDGSDGEDVGRVPRLVRRDGPQERTVQPALASRVAERPDLGEGGSGPAGDAGSAGAGHADPAYLRTQTDAAVADVRRVLARSTRRRVALASAVAVIAGAVAAGAVVWFATRSPAPRVMRTTITPTAAAAVSISGIDRDLAITPDGSRIVYVGANGTQLLVRALDALESVVIFKGAPRGPFVSPDGEWVGFVDGNTSLKKVAMTGGPAVTLAPLDATPRGATWAPDGTVIFATTNTATGLQRVSAAGGTPDVLTRPERALGEADHLWPEMLPGGRALLLTITAPTGGLDAAQVAVLNLQTGARDVLVRGGSHAQYVPSGPGLPKLFGREGGHLVYAAAGTLRAIAFDLARLETRGTPVSIIGQVVTTAFGGVNAAVAGDGTLAYVSGPGGAVGVQRTLVWVSRQGQETSIAAPPRAYLHPRIAPDGASVTLYSQDQEIDIWRWDFARTTLTRLTFDGAQDLHPAWTPDGRRLVFSSERAGARNLYWQAADGTGAVERLTESPNVQNAVAVSPDGTRLIFTEIAPKTGADVMQVQLDATRPSAGSGRGEPVEPRRVTPLVQTPSSEQNGLVSPDGRWLAYEANDSGRFEVYVRPFPDVNSGHWQVSTGGGTRPLWARNGQELFYASPAGALMRVGVERGASWAAATPTLLIKEGYVTVPGGSLGRSYDISPDGQRFLLIKAGGSEQAAAPMSLIVVQHFDEELRRLVPGN